MNTEHEIMTFEVNGLIYKIVIVEAFQGDNLLGLAEYPQKKITLKLEDIDVMIKTLKHELTHVWLEEFGHNQHETKSYNNEDICEIVACSNNFINENVAKFKKNFTEQENNYRG